MTPFAKGCVLRNLRFARRSYRELDADAERALCSLSAEYGLQLSQGELTRIDRSWYVTNAGLLAIAARRRCEGIRVVPLSELSDPLRNRWVVRATVYPCDSSRGFDGIGDASPNNVAESMKGAELRIAETRAVNRALRKVYAIGVCSAEELAHSKPPSRRNTLRAQLNALVTQFQLNPEAVKRYGTEYCGVETLARATEQQVISFVRHLHQHLTADSAATRCLLNGYLAAKAEE
jgi:hypothetical protein